MVTGASTADCAVILLDARKGVLTQTRRHSYLVSLLGIRHVARRREQDGSRRLLQERFREIERQYRAFAEQLGLEEFTLIPVSALRGDNVVERSEAMPWYDGPTLMEYLETVEVDQERMQDAPFRLPVQWVNRPSSDFRGFAGTIAGGPGRARRPRRRPARRARDDGRARRRLRRRPRASASPARR